MNIVKETCQALNLTQKELAERMGVSKPTIERWSATGDIPENAEKHIKLLLQNFKLEKELNEIKTSLKNLSKYF